MAAWRTLGSLVLFLAANSAVWAQTYDLSEQPKAGDCHEYILSMNLAGQMRFNQGGKEVSRPLAAAARHRFSERVLQVGQERLIQKTARHYQDAQATITVAGEKSDRTLRPTRRLLVAHRHNEQIVVYSPVGPLTREELELTGEHLDTLSLSALLPDKPVRIGDTWKVAHAAVQSLCAFEGLSQQDLVCKLEAVKDEKATVSVTGRSEGIILGAVVKLNIQATYQFDLTRCRLVRMDWKLKDERDAGPANPAMSLTLETRLERAAVEQPKELADVALVTLPAGDKPPAAVLPLLFNEAKGRYTLHYHRDWQMVGDTEQHLILRLMDRGDFVAQATVTPWKSAKPGEHLSPQEFKQAMARTPGWEPVQELQAGEFPVEAAAWGYRLAVQGKLDGLEVVQTYYLVAGPKGDQVVVAFTMTPSQFLRIGTRDLTLVGSLTLSGK